MSYSTNCVTEELIRQFFKDHKEELSLLNRKEFYKLAQTLFHPEWKNYSYEVNSFKEHLKSVAKKLKHS